MSPQIVEQRFHRRIPILHRVAERGARDGVEIAAQAFP
jgi:hypothetical protein